MEGNVRGGGTQECRDEQQFQKMAYKGCFFLVDNCLDESWGGRKAIQFKLMWREFMVTLKE